jgi:hypothetical protein
MYMYMCVYVCLCVCVLVCVCVCVYRHPIEGGSHVTLTGHARAGMGHRS